MGDEVEVDSFEIPLHEQSGLIDKGTIDRINLQEIQQQAGALNNVLTRYYSGELNFGTVLPEIENLGYSQERAQQLRRIAQTERTIRVQAGGANIQQHNAGTPSNLTPNQLEAIDRANLQIGGRFHVYTGDDGRQFVYDYRVREDDGTPARFFLPAPEEFNPLTLSQQQEQDERLQDVAPSFLIRLDPFNYPTGQTPDDDFSYSDKTLLDQLSQDYLENPSPESFNSLRENIDLFLGDDARNVFDGDDKLNQFMIDIQYEADFRAQNDGRPQLLSQQEYDFLTTHPDYAFNTNSIVYETLGTDTRYYYDSFRGRARAVPTLDSRGDVVSQDVTADSLRDVLPSSVVFTGPLYQPPDETLSVRTAGGALNNDEQARLRNDMARTINGDIPYRDFLQGLNTEYDLNSEQFFDIAQIVLQRNAGQSISEQDALYTGFYTDEPVYVWTDRGRTTMSQNPQDYINVFGDRQQIRDSVDRIQRTWTTTNYAVRAATNLDPRVQGVPVQPQTYVIEQLERGQLDPELIPPADFLPDRPQNDVNITPEDRQPHTDYYTRPPQATDIPIQNVLEELASGPITGPLERIDSPPVVAGQQTAPVNPQTGENIPAPLPQEQVQRYQEYFNSRQSEFTAFRNMARDILPLFAGAVGGYFAFSLARSRERGTIQEILQQERIFLDALDVRVENAQERLDNIQNLIIQGDEQRATGYQLLELLNIQRGNLAGMEDNPDINPEFLQQQVAVTATQLANSNARLRQISNEINQATENLDDLTNDLNDASISRTNLNFRLQNLMERNRQIITDVYRYNPQILQGFQIGTTLGLVLSGYFFPEYIDIDDNNDFIKADNINYNPKTLDEKKKEKDPLPDKPKQPFNIMKAEQMMIDNTISNNNKIIQPIQKNFIPVKEGNRGANLTYKQIQEYKATLTPSELKNLAGQSLIFGVDDYVLKKPDKCMSVHNENNIIKQKKIKI